jgi:hypothetical protein
MDGCTTSNMLYTASKGAMLGAMKVSKTEACRPASCVRSTEQAAPRAAQMSCIDWLMFATTVALRASPLARMSSDRRTEPAHTLTI